ncbi:MAG: glycosyltransferase family 4 protein [Anaerolineae bacterium]
MRIGLITGEYPPMQGGVGAYTRVLALTLATQGYDIALLSSTQSRTDLVDSHLDLTHTIARWNMPALYAIRRWAEQKRLDVVSLQFETAAYAMSPWMHYLPDALGKIPVVTTFHDLLVPYLFPKAGRLRDWIVMRLARASAGVIATNHEDMARLQELPNAHLIPIGSNILTDVPTDYNRHSYRQRAGVESGGYLLAYFGFINQSKGVETLLQALSKLRADDLPFHLVMIGGRTGASDPSNAAYAEKIDTIIHNMRLDRYIHWTGFVTDAEVSGFLRASDMVVLPFRDGASYRRGSLMAAIQHGCAIITTHPQVEISTFQDGENMLLVPPNDPAEIVKAIKYLMISPALRYHIILGAQDLNHHFDWQHIAQAHIPVFEAAINQKKRA